MTDGELLPHRILLHQFRQIVGHGIIDTLDKALVNGNAAHERGDGLWDREHGAQSVDGDVAHVVLIDDAVVLDNEHTLILALHVHRLHESDILTVWRLGVEMQGINPWSPLFGNRKVERLFTLGNRVMNMFLKAVDTRTIFAVSHISSDYRAGSHQHT